MRAAGSQTRVARGRSQDFDARGYFKRPPMAWHGTLGKQASRPWEREACGCDASGTQEIAAVHLGILSICCCLILTTCLLRRQLTTNAFHECRERCPYLSWRIFL